MYVLTLVGFSWMDPSVHEAAQFGPSLQNFNGPGTTSNS